MTELERVLVALGAELEFPPTPNLAGAVRARLEGRRWLRPIVFAAAALVVGVGIAMAVPPARSAILRFFDIGAATVERVETLPPAQHRPLVAGLGPPLVREDAELAAHLSIRLPRGVRPPARYYARPGLIATLLRVDGTSVLLAEIRDDQTVFAKKAIEKQTTVEPVRLGEFGLWLEGPQHVLMWSFGSASVHVVETRLAGNVLVWVRKGVTYRLEGKLDKSQMLALGHQITR